VAATVSKASLVECEHFIPLLSKSLENERYFLAVRPQSMNIEYNSFAVNSLWYRIAIGMELDL
jgi:hypothetical protein